MGGVLLALRLWWWYRGKFEIAGVVLTFIGSALILFGVIAPRFLVTPRKLWMKLAEGMAYVSSRIILAIVFFLVLTPIGLVKRAMGWDPLATPLWPTRLLLATVSRATTQSTPLREDVLSHKKHKNISCRSELQALACSPTGSLKAEL